MFAGEGEANPAGEEGVEHLVDVNRILRRSAAGLSIAHSLLRDDHLGKVRALIARSCCQETAGGHGEVGERQEAP